MKVTFPHMGHSTVCFKALVAGMGAEVYLPDYNNLKQLKPGLKHSPEWVCFPFKTTLGNFIEALENGCRTIVMATDCGPCRFGFYYAVQERILRDLGYDFDMKYLPQGDLLTFEWAKLLKSMCADKTLFANYLVWRTARIFMMKCKLIQDVEYYEGITRCYESDPGETTKVGKKCATMVDQANRYHKLRQLRSKIRRIFREIPQRKRNGEALKVGLTGEIHVTLDPFTNHNVKRKLGEMGCEVHMDLSLYDWIKHKFHVNFHRKYIEYLSKINKKIGGIQMDIGGEAYWVIGEYINWANHGFDGFVHTYPFTCMPEITAKSIIQKWYGDKIFDLPPAFFPFDEHAGEAGFVTRLESFVELLKIKKEKKVNGSRRR